MKKLALAMVVGFTLSITLLAGAQMYEPPTEANPKDVYCSGFIAAQRLPTDLRIVMAEDAVGRLIYSQNDYVYLGKGADGGVAVGQRYTVVRPFNSPDSPEAEAFQDEHKYVRDYIGGWYANEYVGQYYHDIGQVEVKTVRATSAVAQVSLACTALDPGDVLIPFQPRPVPDYKPVRDDFDRFAEPNGLPIGLILPGKDYAYAFGQGDTVYVTLGSQQGVQVGDYVRLFRPAHNTAYNGYKNIIKGQWKSYRGVPEGVKLPIGERTDLTREVMAEALVVNVQDKASTAVVTSSLRESHAGDFAELLPPAAPGAWLTVEPASIPRGATATLRWKTQLAQDISISPAPGAVGERRGSTSVSPTQTTTYTLRVRGRGGEAEDTATLTVIQPPPPPEPAPEPAPPALADLFAQNVADIFFDFDRSDIRPDAGPALQRTADFLRSYPEARVLIEGYCDVIDGEAYNLRLGNARAENTKNSLVSLGANPNQIETVSRGMTQMFCDTSLDDSCRQLNRRSHFILQ